MLSLLFGLQLVKLAEPTITNIINGDVATNGNVYQDCEVDCDQNTEWKVLNLHFTSSIYFLYKEDAYDK